jgi:hypothetical protein
MGNNGTPPFLPIAPAAAHETWRAKKPTSDRPKIGTTIGAQFTSFNFLNRLSCPVVSSGFGRDSVLRHSGREQADVIRPALPTHCRILGTDAIVGA